MANHHLHIRPALLGALSLSAAWLAACGSTDKKMEDLAANILVGDQNNYTSTGTLSIPTVETAAADLDICWNGAVSDIQCHPVAPLADVDNVALLRFLHLSEEQVEARLAAGQLSMSEVDGYLEFHTNQQGTCAKLSQLSFLGTPIKVVEEYTESTDHTYMLLFATGLDLGVGARTMTFVKPTSSSVNTKVDAPTGCGLLDFSADLSSLTKLAVPTAGPWIIDWRSITRDGQGNAVVFQRIDGVIIGFFAGMTVADVQAKILDIELIATSLWELPVRGARTADLSKAKDRATGALFSGFPQSDGVWMLGLMCSTCQNPAPVLLTVLNPGAVDG